MLPSSREFGTHAAAMVLVIDVILAQRHGVSAMKVYFSSGLMLLALQLLGCNVDVEQTETGVTIAIECGDSPSDEQPSDEEPASR